MQRINNIELINRIRNQNNIVQDLPLQNQNNIVQVIAQEDPREVERQQLNAINVSHLHDNKERIEVVWLKIKAHLHRYPKSDFRHTLKKSINKDNVGKINWELDMEIGEEMMYEEDNANQREEDYNGGWDEDREDREDENHFVQAPAWEESNENIAHVWKIMKQHVKDFPDSYFRHHTRKQIKQNATTPDYVLQLLFELDGEKEERTGVDDWYEMHKQEREQREQQENRRNKKWELEDKQNQLEIQRMRMRNPAIQERVKELLKK